MRRADTDYYKRNMLAIAATVLCVVAAAHSLEDYCKIKCPGSGHHVLCPKSESEITNKICKQYEHGLSDEEKAFILKTLNEKRARVATGQESINKQPPAADMLELEWDKELEATAQAHADNCMVAIKDECPLLADNSRYQQLIDDDHIPLFPNNYRQQTINMVLQKWYEGVLTFKPKEEIGAQDDRLDIDVKDKYAQVVWANTRRVGCGYIDSKLDGGKLYAYRMVCNFTPPGNVDGEAVYKEGPPASACPSGYRASPDIAGLCNESV